MFHDRCVKIAYNGKKSNEGHPLAITANKIRACVQVRKYIDKDICKVFEDHFIVQNHETDTRNAQNSVKVPLIKGEYARKSLYFTCAKIYNELPLKIRRITNSTEFKKRLKEDFS